MNNPLTLAAAFILVVALLVLTGCTAKMKPGFVPQWHEFFAVRTVNDDHPEVDLEQETK